LQGTDSHNPWTKEWGQVREWRHSGYHKGGSPENRIYILKLHRYLDPPVAQDLIERDPEYFASDTELLDECVVARRSLRDLGREECLDHFMECRKAELSFVASANKDKAVAELKETVRHLKTIGPEEEERYGAPLRRWIAALSG
jgi:hypothetical protein